MSVEQRLERLLAQADRARSSPCGRPWRLGLPSGTNGSIGAQSALPSLRAIASQFARST